MARRARPHIFKELLEVISPSIAYRNSTTSVVTVRMVRWAKAALLHSAPARVFRRLSHTGTPTNQMAVCGLDVSEYLALSATATSRVPVAQIGRVDDSYISAVAARNPADRDADICRADNNEPAESLSGQINQAHGSHFNGEQMRKVRAGK